MTKNPRNAQILKTLSYLFQFLRNLVARPAKFLTNMQCFETFRELRLHFHLRKIKRYA